MLKSVLLHSKRNLYTQLHDHKNSNSNSKNSNFQRKLKFQKHLSENHPKNRKNKAKDSNWVFKSANTCLISLKKAKMKRGIYNTLSCS